MREIRATEDLVVEAWAGGDEDRPIVKIRSLEQEQDAEAVGAIVIWPEEIHSLIEALTEVADWLAEQVRKAQS